MRMAAKKQGSIRQIKKLSRVPAKANFRESPSACAVIFYSPVGK